MTINDERAAAGYDTRGIEYAKRINTPAPENHGLCDNCNTAIVGSRSTFTSTYAGVAYEALVCETCLVRFVLRGRSRRSAAECQQFKDTVGYYRTKVNPRRPSPSRVQR